MVRVTQSYGTVPLSAPVAPKSTKKVVVALAAAAVAAVAMVGVVLSMPEDHIELEQAQFQMLAATTAAASPAGTAAAGTGAAAGSGSGSAAGSKPTDLPEWKALLEDCKADPNCMSITRGVEKASAHGGVDRFGIPRR